MLEKAIKELFRVMPNEEVYFSKEGEYSPAPSEKNFLRASYDSKLNLIYFDFEKDIEWEQVEDFYSDENNFLTVEFACDAERFYDLATEYHTLSPPVDETIMDYELRITKEDEILEIVSEDPYTLTFYISHENNKTGDIKSKILKVKKTEAITNDELKKIFDNQKRNSRKRPEKEFIRAVIETPRDELEKILNQSSDEEEVILDYEEMQEKVKKVRDIMLKMPNTLKKGSLKVDFEFTPDCSIDYYINKNYESAADLHRDANLDWTKDTIHTGNIKDIFGFEGVGFDIEYSNGKCKVMGRMSTDLLGEGFLKEFLNKFNT